MMDLGKIKFLEPMKNALFLSIIRNCSHYLKLFSKQSDLINKRVLHQMTATIFFLFFSFLFQNTYLSPGFPASKKIIKVIKCSND